MEICVVNIWLFAIWQRNKNGFCFVLRAREGGQGKSSRPLAASQRPAQAGLGAEAGRWTLNLPRGLQRPSR